MIASQDFFDKLTNSVMEEDAEGFAGLLAYPVQVISPDRNLLINSEADARMLFQEFRAGIDYLASDTFILLAREVTFLSPDLLTSAFDVHLMQGTQRQIPSFSGSATLHFAGGEWKMTSMSNAVDVRQWGGRRALATEHLPRTSHVA